MFVTKKSDLKGSRIVSFVHTERLHPAESAAHAHHTHGHHTAECSAVRAVVCVHCSHFSFGSVSNGANIAVFLSFTLAAGYFFGKTFPAVGILHAKDAIATRFVK